ncbi:MAG TPA: hypothetical protein VJ736_05870 [Actinomycetota bacterium]|jgi:hypothetical protein|nr:hypothetical protein [Actinomycetota bacterium]
MPIEHNQGLRATLPGGSVARRPVRTQAQRVCRAEDCETLLSTYNASGTCWLHTKPRPQPSYARTPRVSELDPPRQVVSDEELIAIVKEAS